MLESRGIVTVTCGRPFIPTVERISGSFRFGKRAALIGSSMKKTFPKTEEELADQCGSLRSEEHTSELQSHFNLLCPLLLEKKTTPTYSLPLPSLSIGPNHN